MAGIPNLSSRFRGTLIGALVGDCLGGPFEGDALVSKSHLVRYINQLLDPKVQVPYKPYTDDTAMTKCVAESLIHSKGFDAQDMAKRFTTEYFKNPKRGYGGSARFIFKGLKTTKFEDPYGPAKDQFGGNGSYGNGAAMRISPVALLYCNNPSLLLETATLSSQITHANMFGYRGAILQCLAVTKALKASDINSDKFLDELICEMKDMEKNDVVEKDSDNEDTDEEEEILLYSAKLEMVKKFLNKSKPPPIEDIQHYLGVEVSALKSVPTAIYCFLAGQKPISGFETDNKFIRSLQFAISLGGDTDTIGSMTGAMAGAQGGMEIIPKELLPRCEDSETVLKLSDELYDLHKSLDSSSSAKQASS